MSEAHAAGVSDSASFYSSLVIPNIGEKTSIAGDTDARVIVKAVVVKTIGTRSLTA